MSAPEYLRRAFLPGGDLSSAFRAYEPREGQVRMALAVDAAFSADEPLLVEAPCGCGKSLAALIPLMHHASASGSKGLVTTATIALQEQLVNVDLPIITEHVLPGTKFALMKGARNYLCRRKLNARGGNNQRLNEEERTYAELMTEWEQETDTGDISELPFTPPDHLWRALSSGADECLGGYCPFRDRCYKAAAWKNASKAQVVVANHHLLMAHIQHDFAVLPTYQYLVCDEGHELVDTARNCLGWTLYPAMINQVRDWLENVGDDATPIGRTLGAVSAKWWECLQRFYSNDYSVRLKDTLPFRADALIEALELAHNRALTAASVDAGDKAYRARAAMAAKRAGKAIQSLLWVEDKLTYDDWCYWIDESSQGLLQLQGRPIDVASRLRAGIFETTPKTVITSATLQTDSGFRFIAEGLGFPEGGTTLAVDTPFHHEAQSIVVIPENISRPNERNFASDVASVLSQSVEIAGGRTLALFASYANMNAVHKQLDLPYPVLRQGDAPRSQLVGQFREDPSTVLLGVASLWQGVDVQGDSCQVVLIDKLPFPSPGEPIVDAIHARLGRRAFWQYDLPRAIIRFRQGAGRLIRSKTDRGVLVLCDRRLVDKDYGKRFLQALPKMQIARNVAIIETWLGE